MSRRPSRPLFGILAVTLVIGGSAYWLTHRKSSTSSASTPNAKNMVAVNGGSSAGTSAGHPGKGSTTKPSDPLPAAHVVKPLINTTTTGNPLSASNTGVAPGPISATAVADGKAKIESGELVAGRKILNDALLSGTLSPGDTAAAKQAIAEANKTLVFSARRLNDDVWEESYVVRSGDLMQKIAFKANVTPDFLCRVNGLADARKLRAGATIKLIHGPFHAVVTKHTFTMDLYLSSPAEKDSLYVGSFPVGLGKDDTTPTGAWAVEQRIPNPKYYSPRGEGVIEAGDPKNPLGKFWIALTGTDGNAIGKTSYGIHGTIEPDSIGKMASMGCIRMRNEDVAVVFELLVAGKSTVVVKD